MGHMLGPGTWFIAQQLFTQSGPQGMGAHIPPKHGCCIGFTTPTFIPILFCGTGNILLGPFIIFTLPIGRTFSCADWVCGLVAADAFSWAGLLYNFRFIWGAAKI